MPINSQYQLIRCSILFLFLGNRKKPGSFMYWSQRDLNKQIKQYFLPNNDGINQLMFSLLKSCCFTQFFSFVGNSMQMEVFSLIFFSSSFRVSSNSWRHFSNWSTCQFETKNVLMLSLTTSNKARINSQCSSVEWKKLIA